MANLAVYTSAAFTNSSGVAVAAGATVEVRREDTGALASIFSDEAGTAAITNPSAFADSNGRFLFYAAGIDRGYSVKVTSGADDHTLHNVAIGTAGQLDQSAFVRSSQFIFKGLIGGLTYSNNATDVVNDIDVAVGYATDTTGALVMSLSSAITKRLDAAWAVGTNQGGLDTGSIGNSDYYIWLIARTDLTVLGEILFSLSPTAPTMPANYTFKRLIGWFKRVGATIVLFHTYERGGGEIDLEWDSPTLDVSLANTLTTSPRTDTIKVPLTFSVIAHINVIVADASGYAALIYGPDKGALAASVVSGSLSNAGNPSAAASAPTSMRIRTSSTGTISAVGSAATADLYAVSTVGFTWARRN